MSRTSILLCYNINHTLTNWTAAVINVRLLAEKIFWTRFPYSYLHSLYQLSFVWFAVICFEPGILKINEFLDILIELF